MTTPRTAALRGAIAAAVFLFLSCATRSAQRSSAPPERNVLIVVCVAAWIGVGAYIVGHAADQPAKQLDTVISEPARAASVTAEANLQSSGVQLNGHQIIGMRVQRLLAPRREFQAKDANHGAWSRSRCRDPRSTASNRHG